MNLDQMLIEAGITPKGDAFTYTEINALRALVQAVEQATLERAAQIAESEPKVWDIDAPSPQQRIALKIRALKDSND